MATGAVDLAALDRLGLPVEEAVEAVRAGLADRGTAVLQAEPGAGKTTVVPLRLLGEPWLEGGRILVLEPRRVAARAAARRMSSLVGDRVGGLVGVRTRDDTRVGPDTRVEVITEGVLTRRIQHEPELDDVAAIVFDEFHERSLTVDLGLALALDVRAALRPDLRLLVMSATIDVDRVADLLGGGEGPAPVARARGRLHPVTVAWRPRGARDPLAPAVADAVRAVSAEREGDVLVFLPGAGEIRRTARLLGGARDPAGRPIVVRPLYGALPAAEQDLALAVDPDRTRVVLATDIAETSLTVEGVRSVVDSGLTRSPRFDPGSGMTRLATLSISRASAEQRAGRAGRTAPGHVVRLWSEAEHAGRREHTDPEIVAVDLASFVLDAAAWGELDPTRLALLDPPPTPALDEARSLLRQLGALDADGAPTAAGRRMADLPVHPRLAALLEAGRQEGLGWTACLIAAALEERDVLRGRADERPVDLDTRLSLIDDPRRPDPSADDGARHRVRGRAKDIARRLGVRPGAVALHDIGRLLLGAYPDRVGQRRGTGRGRYRLRSGAGAWMPEHEVPAAEPYVVVADTDGDRTDARIRIAAGVDEPEVRAAFAADIERRRSVVWDEDRGDVVDRVEERLGALVLSSHTERPASSPEVVAILVDRVRDTGLELLPWTAACRSLQHRAAFVRAHRDPEDWPALDDDSLLADLGSWLAPMLVGARGRGDLGRLDLLTSLRTRLGWDRVREVDRLAPERVELPSGRAAPLDYGDGRPQARARVQELYGLAVHPHVLDGREPVVFELTSPADRPVQVTDDVVGFWAGSWAEVRKEMAGRYPKHDWPTDPAAARPSGPGGRRRRR